MIELVNQIVWTALGAAVTGVALHLFGRARHCHCNPLLRWVMLLGWCSYVVTAQAWNWMEPTSWRTVVEIISGLSALIGMAAFARLAWLTTQPFEQAVDGPYDQDRHGVRRSRSSRRASKSGHSRAW